MGILLSIIFFILMIVGLALTFWTGLIIGHETGLVVGLVIFIVSLVLFLIQTGTFESVKNALGM